MISESNMKQSKTWVVLGLVAVLAITSVLVVLWWPKEPSGNDPIIEVPDNVHDEAIDTALKTLIVDPDSDPMALIPELDNYNAIDFDNRLFRPVFDTKLSLSISTTSTKPRYFFQTEEDTPPIVAQPDTIQYQDNVFVDSSGDTLRWFAIRKDPDISPAKYIWQISLSPFPGREEDPLNPPGLISSQTVDASKTEFSVDLKQALNPTHLRSIYKLTDLKLRTLFFVGDPVLGAAPVQKTYYVRVIALDNQDKVIGDGGTGQALLYGQPVSKSKIRFITQIEFLYNLLSTRASGEPYQNGEYPNNFYMASERTLDASNSDRRYCFLPEGYPSDSVKLVLQVSKTAFSGNWETQGGLEYQRILEKGDPNFTNLTIYNPLCIDFSTFAPDVSTLELDQFIAYYVRVVTLTPTATLGTYAQNNSRTVKIKYGRVGASSVVFYETVKIDPIIPQITDVDYIPIRWESTGWEYRYVVIRQPLEKEIFLGFGGNKPYDGYPVGTKLDFTPVPEDESWWEEAIGAVVEFFSDLVGYAAALTDWVSSTYNGLKAGLITLVAQNLPLIPDSLRDELEDALTAMVDYGLASMGIPPTLPNFDDLTDMGTDYLATVAMETAGIPATDYMKDGLVELGESVTETINTSTNTSTPNPMGWDWIKQDPDFMYRPAYILLTLHNPYDVATPSGTLTAYNEATINSQQFANIQQQELYHSFNHNTHYSTFKSLYNMRIPSLAPGQTLVVPIFLEEMIGKSYWSGGHVVTRNDYSRIYYWMGEYTFNISIQYDLIPADIQAQQQGLEPYKIYTYSTPGNSVSFKTEPFVPYSVEP
jgi:hypothetical protein